ETLQYKLIFRREQLDHDEMMRRAQLCAPHKGQDVTKGWGLGLAKASQQEGWLVYGLEFEGKTITRFDSEGMFRRYDDAFGALADLRDRLVGLGTKPPFHWANTPKVRLS